MPSTITQEQAAAAAANAEKKREELRQKANAYPLQFLNSMAGGNVHFSNVTVANDTRPFFVDPFKRRICCPPPEYMTALDTSTPFGRATLHLNSFKIDSNAITSAVLEQAGTSTTAALEALSDRQTLEIDPETNLPMMAKEGDAKTKRPVISATKETNFFSHSEVFMRYFPWFVKGKKEACFSDVTVANTTLTAALFNKYLYNIDPAEKLPDKGSDAATELWQTNVRDKLFVVAAEAITTPGSATELPRGANGKIDKFGIYFTMHIEDGQPPLDTVECQGKRWIQQADDRLVKHWIDLTTSLVGQERVPEVAKFYVANSLGKVNFDKDFLSSKAAEVCKATWQSLIEAGKDVANDKGRIVNQISAESAETVTKSWGGKQFCNPSIDITDADNNVHTTILFNSSDAERAMLGLYFSEAGFHDAKTFQAADFNANLKKMSAVFKNVAYTLLGKEPPLAVSVFDSETASAAAPKRRKRAAPEPEASAGVVAELMEVIKGLEKKLDAITETTDAIAVEMAREATKNKKFRGEMRRQFDDDEDA